MGACDIVEPGCPGVGGTGGRGRFHGLLSLTVFLSLLQAKFLSQDQINGRLALLFD